MAKQITLIVLLALIALSKATDWCSITCDRDGIIYKHTMCLLKQSQPAPKCNQVFKQGLDQSEINYIVNHHNEVRRSAANLPPLVWDGTLAAVAQRWANQCDFKHDTCRDLKVGEYVGQNLAVSYTSTQSGFDLKYTMSGWAEEKRFVNQNIIASYPTDKRTQDKVGHYTQMVWRKTTKVGCGLVSYFDPNERKHVHLLVCNYDVGGNHLGARVF